MSSISQERRHTQNTTDWATYREQRAYLADLFPAIRYSGQPKIPLANGIKYALIGANTGLSNDDIKHFLRAYTFGPKYLRTLTEGANRYDLDGFVSGTVSAQDSLYAAKSLSIHYAHKDRRRTVRKIGLRAVESALRVQDVAEYAEAA